MQYENERIEYKSQMVHDMGVYVRQGASVCRPPRRIRRSMDTG